MGRMYEQEFTALLGKEKGLECHIEGNFYPPFPDFVKKSIKKGFKKYWAGKIGLQELSKACYLKNVDGLYTYFSSFLEEEYDG